jgi:hypothetical protein
MHAFEDYPEQLESFFRMDLLDTLNPDDNGQMAQIVIGAYVANTRGLKQADEYIAGQQGAVNTQFMSASIRAEVAANDNIRKLRELTGARQLRLTDIAPQGGSILYKDFSRVPEAQGTINPQNSHQGSELLRGSIRYNLGRLCVYGPGEGEYYVATVLDDEIQPRIGVEVITLHPALTAWQRIRRRLSTAVR